MKLIISHAFQTIMDMTKWIEKTLEIYTKKNDVVILISSRW